MTKADRTYRSFATAVIKMGVDLYVFDFLLKFRGRSLGNTLWLGRQGFHISDHSLGNSVLHSYDKTTSIDQIKGTTGFCEELFRYLGSDSVKSLDNSDFEGAEIIHDLNRPIPGELANQYDCIFDGGTLEHIFDFPTAISNVKKMLKKGGLCLLVDGANNFLGHGLYQFSPELLWRTFSRDNGFEIELMQLVDVAGVPRPQNVQDPAVLGHRTNVTMSTARTYILMAARKTANITDERQTVQQSDYTAAWGRAGDR
jgi:SAM-dependent methyltransferase